MNALRTLVKILLPVLVVSVALVGACTLITTREKPQTRAPEEVLPLVRVLPVELRELRLSVASQGTVGPRTVSALVPEVSGRVLEVGRSFAAGGFFESGEVLLRIDPHDYRQALVQARSQVAQAELRLARERAEADVARREWNEIGQGEPTALTLHEPQVADAAAALEGARAALVKAERDLERTEIRAPYAGRIREKQVDVGQFVVRGAPLATIYAVDYAEVRLPLPDSELAFVDLPLVYRDDRGEQTYPVVILRADFAGRIHEWRGRVVRTEGEIDPASRMVHVVAQVKDPYARGSDPDRPPLAAGLFVTAEILGHRVDEVAVLPRAAIREDDQVLVVDAEDRLRFRTVSILRSTGGEVIVQSGLSDGERICLSPLSAVTDGMRVRPIEAADEVS
jgi:RND family efflux transporter MFP subunit